MPKRLNYVNILFWTGVFLFLLLGIDSLIMTYPDEGRNAFATLYMINSGDLIVPYYNGEIRYDKPPLLYYTAILMYKFLQIFGFEDLEVSFRLVSIFSTFLSCLVTFELSKYFIKNRYYQYLSVVIYLGFVNIFIESKAFVPEPLLSLFINLSLLSFYKIYQNNQDNNIRTRNLWTYIFWISIGLGMLAKGVIAFIIVFLVICVFLFICKELHLLKLLFGNPLAFLIGLFIGSGWFILVGIKTHGEFLYQFFMVHNVGRFTGSSNMHPNPFYFYVIVLLINLIPLMEIFILSLISFVTSIKDRNEIKHMSFLTTYFLAIVIFYSLSTGKVHHYILPSLVPLCILMSFYTEKTLNTTSKRSTLLFILYLLPVIALFIKVPHEFENLKKYLIIIFSISPIVYFITINIQKGLILHITALKILVFYIIITISIHDIFPNQKEFIQAIKGKKIFMVGDISTVSFYNLYVNKSPKTRDIWYVNHNLILNSEDLSEIRKSLMQNQEVLIFTKGKYLDTIMKSISEFRQIDSNLEIEIKDMMVAQSKIKVVKISKNN
ncbi:MAG: glycosyltransferase family 39 protein [bacterium]|nr:glycosyltransferase family 39 protein [bacterium]